jgi:hypothetical protein
MGLKFRMTCGYSVSNAARNLFDSLNFRHGTRQAREDCRSALYRAFPIPTSTVCRE